MLVPEAGDAARLVSVAALRGRQLTLGPVPDAPRKLVTSRELKRETAFSACRWCTCLQIAGFGSDQDAYVSFSARASVRNIA